MQTRLWSLLLVRICLIAPLLTVECLHAQQGEATLEIIHVQTAHDALFDIELIGKSGWAVGDHGLLLKTQDGGHTWQTVSSPTDRALLGLDLKPDGAGVIVGQEGTILRVATRGADWSIVEAGTDARLFAVSLDISGFGLAVGEFGTVLRTSDHGQSWVPVTIDWNQLLSHQDKPHLYDVLVEDAVTALVVGEYETVMKSTDSGKSWTILNQGDVSLFAITKTPNGQYWSMGQSGLLMHSNDLGRTWDTVTLNQQSELLDMEMDASGEGVLIALGALFFTTDAGSSWHVDPSLVLPFQWYQAVAPTIEGAYLLAGAFGSIVRLTNAADSKLN